MKVKSIWKKGQNKRIIDIANSMLRMLVPSHLCPWCHLSKKKNHISPNLFPLFKSLSHASLLYTRIHYSLPCHCLSTVLWPFILIQGNSHQQTRRKIPILADDSFLCCHISYCSIFSIKILLEQKKRKKSGWNGH